MKTIKSFLAAVFFTALAFSGISKAEDIDLYSGLGSAAGTPNVLIIIDNAANFDASTSGTCTYSDSPSTVVNMAGKLAGLEQCALNNVIDSLPTNSDGTALLNIGIMFYNTTNLSSAYPSSGCVASNNGGCLFQALEPMTATNKTALKALIKGWTIGNIKANAEGTAIAMQEAWAYYAGSTGASGRSYAGIQPASGCQKNFVVFLGNAYNTNGTPGDGGSSSPSSLLATAGATSSQQSQISISYAHGAACNTSNPYYTMPNHTNSSGLYADEWAYFMNQGDLYGSLDGTQNITTYAIAALGASCKPDYPALLTSVAAKGGGKYYAVNADVSSEITQAFLKILNEVQAVNSVFSSSTLPVSVNTQGTYLNQVFMGMFRPDANGLPRWVGNLKQYQFIFDSTTQTLSLGDSTGAAAISSAGTGFISPNAISFWTKKDTSSLPDSTGGFWVNAPTSAGAAFDSPDGEVVEKGGAAQILRLANLTDDYTTSAGLSTNPRKLYTYCPSGSSCNASLTNSANAFEPNNSGITATSFGTTSTVTVTNITISNATTGTATVTTSGVHGFVAGTSVTIAGASPTAYNGTYTIATVPTTTTFTVTGVTVTPPTPATANTYQASNTSLTSVAIASMSRTTSGTNTETVTVTTSTNHGFATGNSITITGVTSSRYNGTYTITVPNGASGNTSFTYSISILPPTPATGSYSVALSSSGAKTISALSCTVSGNGNGKKATVTATTSTAHGLNANDYVTIAGASPSGYNGSYNLATASGSSFTYVLSPTGSSAACPATATAFGTATPAATQQTISSLTRTGTTNTSTATATIPTANRFATGDIVNIGQITAGTNESAYVLNSVSITCTTTACTTFTYPITVSPSTTITLSSATASKGSLTPVDITTLTRSGATATAVLASSLDLSTSSSVNVLTKTGLTTPANEAAYTGSFTVTCTVPGALSNACTTFTYPVTTSPADSSTGSATAPVSPDKATLINWVRGQDNYGDEKGPGGTVTVRPSVHGDVLHSRPIVINYGGTNGVIAFYGANDGVFRAVNGNQTANPTSSTLPVPGSELWGFIPTEFYGKLNRLRTNSPELQLPTTPSGITPTPQKKDYFVDGPTGVYQVINASGATTTANIFLSMRRGGRLIYALDVSTPTSPQYMWKKDNSSTDFTELGLTWSEPKVAFVRGYADGSGNLKPVLIFGAGYDTNEDSEPPVADSMGRGIFILDAATGAMIWSTRHDCTGVASTCVAPSGMDYSIPADITLVDKNSDGVIDRLYATDVGGNVWRVDLEPSAGNLPANWQVKKLAALGCDEGAPATAGGACLNGSTPRKFFYKADVIPTSTFDAVLAGSGDREHPLATNAANSVTNRVYMLKDTATGNDGGSITTITQTPTSVAGIGLVDETNATTTNNYSNATDQRQGYFITMLSGEKVVNAPATAAGSTFFGTNQPATSSNSCVANLGTARGYTLSPLTGTSTSVTFSGGGLPPTPVYGFVNITVTNADGSTSTKLVPFVIGAGNSSPTCTGPDCTSSIGSIKPTINISSSRTRTHWYIERDQ